MEKNPNQCCLDINIPQHDFGFTKMALCARTVYTFQQMCFTAGIVYLIHIFKTHASQRQVYIQYIEHACIQSGTKMRHVLSRRHLYYAEFVLVNCKNIKPTKVVILVFKPKALNQHKCGMQNDYMIQQRQLTK